MPSYALFQPPFQLPTEYFSPRIRPYGLLQCEAEGRFVRNIKSEFESGIPIIDIPNVPEVNLDFGTVEVWERIKKIAADGSRKSFQSGIERLEISSADFSNAPEINLDSLKIDSSRIRGAAHFTRSTPCQDSFEWIRIMHPDTVVFALSDGISSISHSQHAARYFTSCGVEIAAALIREREVDVMQGIPVLTEDFIQSLHLELLASQLRCLRALGVSELNLAKELFGATFMLGVITPRETFLLSCADGHIVRGNLASTLEEVLGRKVDCDSAPQYPAGAFARLWVEGVDQKWRGRLNTDYLEWIEKSCHIDVVCQFPSAELSKRMIVSTDGLRHTAFSHKEDQFPLDVLMGRGISGNDINILATLFHLAVFRSTNYFFDDTVKQYQSPDKDLRKSRNRTYEVLKYLADAEPNYSSRHNVNLAPLWKAFSYEIEHRGAGPHVCLKAFTKQSSEMQDRIVTKISEISRNILFTNGIGESPDKSDWSNFDELYDDLTWISFQHQVMRPREGSNLRPQV